MMMVFFTALGLLVLVSSAVYLTRSYYLKQLSEIKRMCLRLSQGGETLRLKRSGVMASQIAVILNDVSRQYNTQIQSIQDEKDKLQAILAGMTEGVVVVGSLGRLQHVSPNIRHMLELRSTKWDDRPYWEIIRHQEINEAIKLGLIEKKAVRREIVDLSTPKAYFSMQISPVINSNNELFAVVAVLHDITELKQLELKRAEFVANVSHELKTPLTSIKGYVETLHDAIHDDQESVERFLDIIKKQTQRLENLVNDLLILSSLESSAIKMDLMPESVANIVDSVMQAQRQIINQSGHYIVIDVNEALPKVLVDRLRMDQVFINLIDNAIKFTPQKGKISISAQKSGDFVQVTVADTGIGIAPEHLPRLFERFYRVDKARSRETGGTGLGLSIVSQIIYAHRGKVEVDSKLGEGSRFSIFLPIASSLPRILQ